MVFGIITLCNIAFRHFLSQLALSAERLSLNNSRKCFAIRLSGITDRNLLLPSF